MEVLGGCGPGVSPQHVGRKTPLEWEVGVEAVPVAQPGECAGQECEEGEQHEEVQGRRAGCFRASEGPSTVCRLTGMTQERGSGGEVTQSW